jgi:isocitrate dehydrogenase (NAD+)
MAAVTVISGEGIGPEVVSAARKVLDQAVPNIEWDEVPAGEDAYNKYGTAVPPHTLESIRRTRVVLEGPLNYDEGADHAPPHSILRKQLGLRVNIRHAIHFPGVPSPFPGTHLVIIRDVTEDLSRGVQQMVGPDAGIAVKYITRASVERSAEMAYRYAVDHGFHRVTIANQVISQRTTDGIFLSAAFAVAERFPVLKVEE